MVIGDVRRSLKRRGTNRQHNRITFPLPTHLWRRVTRRILENSVRFNDTDRALNNESEDRRLELMVGTAPFSQIRANPMAWALFMRGFEVGRHFMQPNAGDLQRDEEPDLRESQLGTPSVHQMSGESTPLIMMEAEGGPIPQALEADTHPEMLLLEELAREGVTLSVDDGLSPCLEEVLALMDECQSRSTGAEQVHVPSASEDSTSTDYTFLLDDDDLEL